MTPHQQPPVYAFRHWLVLLLFTLGLAALSMRAVNLQVLDNDYLQAQGDARYLRVVRTPPARGVIMDRYGEPLAVSTPVDSIWAHPPTLLEKGHSWQRLGKLLGISPAAIQQHGRENKDREFAYLKRHLPPETAKQVMAVKIPGVDLIREYRRYYPAGPVTAHVLGFTNIDDTGQEGIELAYDEDLTGRAGKTRVLKDRVGHIVERVDLIAPVVDGRDLRIS